MLFRDVVLAVSGNPLVRGAVMRVPAFRRAVRRFVSGETLDDAVAAVRRLQYDGLETSLDHLGESVANETMAAQATADILALLDRIYAEGLSSHVSVKLTQLGLELGADICLANMRTILERAKQVGVFVRIDMEGSALTDVTLRIYHELRQEYERLGVVIQAYLRRSEADVTEIAAAGGSIRLCKGAYSEPPEIAFPTKEEVDANFQRLLEIMFRPESLAAGARVAVATHDIKLIRWTRGYTRSRGIQPSEYEFQMLYGIRRDVQQNLAKLGHPVRIYVPYGTHWYPYFARRLAERPANLFFMVRALFGA